MKLDKLRKKYGYIGASYQELISKILYENALNINNYVISLDDTYYKNVAKRFNKKFAKRFVVPDISNEMYDSAIQIRKSAEKGKLISDTLKDQLRENLREIFNIKTDKTGQSKVIVQTGKKAGIINQSMIDLYEEKITETFTNYLKDTNEKIPANIKTIATTEVRSAVHDIQHYYVGELVRRNPSLKIMKKWIHNPNLSKIKPRDNHANLGRLKPIPYNENWTFISQSGKTVSASRPHDPSLPPEEVIGCHCDIEYQGVYTMDKSKELNEVRKTLINMNIVAKGRRGYDVGTIVDRKDGKWKKTGEGQWEKVRDEEQSLEGDDKELDVMIDDKKNMQSEMEKEDLDKIADMTMNLIEAEIITQEDLDYLSPEEIQEMHDQLMDEKADELAEEYNKSNESSKPEDENSSNINIPSNERIDKEIELHDIMMQNSEFRKNAESDAGRKLTDDEMSEYTANYIADLNDDELQEFLEVADENSSNINIPSNERIDKEIELHDAMVNNQSFRDLAENTAGRKLSDEELSEYASLYLADMDDEELNQAFNDFKKGELGDSE